MRDRQIIQLLKEYRDSLNFFYYSDKYHEINALLNELEATSLESQLEDLIDKYTGPRIGDAYKVKQIMEKQLEQLTIFIDTYYER